MSELSMGQRDTIRLAYRAAEKSGREDILQNRVQQLARDFGVSEDDILGIATSNDMTALKTPVVEKSATHDRHARRGEWTTMQIRQLTELHNQGKGPTEIAGTIGCDVKRVTAKLYNLKKSGALTEPAPAPKAPEAPAPATHPVVPEPERKMPDAVPPPAVPPIAEEPTPEVPPTMAQPAEDAADDSPVEDTEYEVALAKLAEPETAEIDLAKEALDLKDHFELTHSAKACRLQSDFDKGWTTLSFDAYGRRYSVSLRQKHRKASS